MKTAEYNHAVRVRRSSETNLPFNNETEKENVEPTS